MQLAVFCVALVLWYVWMGSNQKPASCFCNNLSDKRPTFFSTYIPFRVYIIPICLPPFLSGHILR